MANRNFRLTISPHSTYSIEYDDVLFSGRSDFQQIEVIQSIDFGRMLVLDGVINLTELDEAVYHEMLVHVPLFSHPNPESVLIIGGGDGGTAREVLRHTSLTKVRQVEIDARVIEVCKRYFPSISHGFDNPRLDLTVTDAISFVMETTERFDVILVDSTDSIIEQSRGLFSETFYRACMGILNENGILAAQVGDHLFQPEVVDMVFENMKKAFNVVRMFLAPVPAYTVVPYSFALCSASGDYMDTAPGRFNGDFSTRYYNREIHQASFALPEYLKKSLR